MRTTPRVALLGPVFLVSACAALPISAPGGIDGPVLTSDRPGAGSGGMDAIVAGGLVLEDGCLYLAPGDAFDEVPPDQRYAVIWPYDTRWDAEAEAVLLRNGESVVVGDVVTGGGGYVTPEAGAGVTQEVADEALRCAQNASPGEVAVFNAGSAVERG